MNEIEIFNAALKLSAAERVQFLDLACKDNPELRRQIEELLKAHFDSETFLHESPGPPASRQVPSTVAHSPTQEHSGTMIAGRYKLLEAIGEGGMGSVWVADQSQPVKRKVAVKLIKAGMDSKSVLARFEAERQALAVMDHPNIAKVLDGGLTELGRPYFVMEYVKGIPITEYCDAAKLGVSARLQLFIQVCQAVQHAHQKGIIHRDLKPSNILVAPYDDKPVPKVIDFGLAKAIHQSLTENTLHTAHDMVLGTPLYMSPEQAQLNNIDIDTRSDVYSLGVLLYELLTGSTPLEKQRFKQAAWDEMRRMIREEDPPLPSHRLSSVETLPSVAASRHTEPARLTRLVRGELDWIVMKALEKDRTRRYETANGFAADVLRYLSGEPVTAAPPSLSYRIRKFVRKNRVGVMAASLVFLALLLGIGGTTLGLFRALSAEGLASERLKEANQARTEEAAQRRLAEARRQEAEQEREIAETRRQEAEQNLAYARKGNEILGSVFAGLDPQAKYTTVSELRNALRDNLENAVEQLQGSAIGDPLAVAEMQNRLGISMIGLGLFKPAIGLFERALETRTSGLGPDHPDTLISMNNLASAYHSAGQLDKAMPLKEQTLELLKAQLGPDHPDTLTSMNNLAMGYGQAGQLAKALPLWEQTLERLKAQFGPDHPQTLACMSNLAAGYLEADQLDKALPMLEQTLQQLKAQLGPNHPHTLSSMNNLARAYSDASQLDKALPLWEQTLELLKAQLGPDHPHTLTNMNSLAAGYLAAAQPDKAVPLWEQTLELLKGRQGPDHPETLANMRNLAAGYRAAGQLDKALPLLEQVLEQQKIQLGPDHPNTLMSMHNLAVGYGSLKRHDRSIPLFQDVLKLHTNRLGRNHPNTQMIAANLGANYQEAGLIDEAIPLLEQAYRASRQQPALRWVGQVLLNSYSQQGETNEKVNTLIQEELSDARQSLPPASPQLANQLEYLGRIQLRLLQWTEAESLFRECLAVRQNTSPEHWLNFNTQVLLGQVLLGQKKFAEAEPSLLQGYERMKACEEASSPTGNLRISETLEQLVSLYTDWHAAQPDQGYDTKADLWRQIRDEHRAGQ